MRILGFFIAVCVLSTPFISSAQTSEFTSNEVKIASILQQIQALQLQLAQLTGSTTPAATFTNPTGVSGLDSVRERLHDILASENFLSVLQEYRQGASHETSFTSALREAFGNGQTNPQFSRTLSNIGVAQHLICPLLNRTLGVGSEGPDVEALQAFLRERGFFTHPENTTYFGAITEAALKRFQEAQGIVSSGSAATTGWGVVGPQTRARIQALCGDSATPSSSTPTPTPSAGQCVFAGTSYINGTVVVPCRVADPLSACFSGTHTQATFTHPRCTSNGTWVWSQTGETVSTQELNELETVGGILKTIYDPSGTLSL